MPIIKKTKSSKRLVSALLLKTPKPEPTAKVKFVMNVVYGAMLLLILLLFTYAIIIYLGAPGKINIAQAPYQNNHLVGQVTYANDKTSYQPDEMIKLDNKFEQRIVSRISEAIELNQVNDRKQLEIPALEVSSYAGIPTSITRGYLQQAVTNLRQKGYDMALSDRIILVQVEPMEGASSPVLPRLSIPNIYDTLKTTGYSPIVHTKIEAAKYRRLSAYGCYGFRAVRING